MTLLPGVRSATVDTDRLRMHYIEAGPTDATPIVMIHGNLSTGRFYEHLFLDLPDGYRIIAPDMRGFGDTEPLPIDATRGLADWAEDIGALLAALGVDRPPHLVGWSTGGAAIVRYAHNRPVASLTFIDPVAPYGFGGTHRDGKPCFADFAGTGGGTGAPELVSRLVAGDTSADSPFSIRSVMRAAYWAPTHVEPREDVLVAEVLKTVVGDDGYPGDSTPSPNWPGFAPGTRGILNALSPKYCDWSDIVELDPKPPVLWTHGEADLVVSDNSALDMGTLGATGQVPDWPGNDAFPPQPMVSQIRDVLGRYADAGGRVRTEMFAGSGHGPHFDARDRWIAVFTEFLDSR
ncbi:alpha/beta fold hydrolase [Pseudonocardia hispaniensis]|uniref:Alpha/beta fold hydrolase n=1 Tax=Pseudonocardia hispaniensis TaxID=904933 RepID=A0ABW1J3V0_9PSEU